MINPFYWLEIRIRASEKRLWIIALFFLLSVLLFGGGILTISIIESYKEIIMGELGIAIMYTLLFWHGAILVVLSPLASAGRISQEREQRTLPALINTSVSPYKIVWGKLLAAWTFILWLSSLVLPFLGIGILWGGLSYWKVLAFIIINISVSMVIASIALGFSGIMRRAAIHLGHRARGLHRRAGNRLCRDSPGPEARRPRFSHHRMEHGGRQSPLRPGSHRLRRTSGQPSSGRHARP